MSEFASILITSFNRVEILQASIESLWECTHYPYELIIHDDGSDLPTVDFLMDILKEGWISTLILNPRKHNRGCALGTDRCFNISQGDYVVRMDGDEEYTPGWLAKAVRAMELFPEIAILSLQSFGHHHKPNTSEANVDFPMWDNLELAAFEREGTKISVAWCTPGGQFMLRREVWARFGPWWSGYPSQESITFKASVCPMFRLLAHSRSRTLPAVTDVKAHWEKYKDTGWLAVIDPPVVSSHWGHAKSAIPIAKVTAQRGPLLYSKEGPIPPISSDRGAAFGPMKGYNFGKDLDRFGWIKRFHPMREEWNRKVAERKRNRK